MFDIQSTANQICKENENITISKRKNKEKYVWMTDVMKLTCKGIEI